MIKGRDYHSKLLSVMENVAKCYAIYNMYMVVAPSLHHKHHVMILSFTIFDLKQTNLNSMKKTRVAKMHLLVTKI